MKLLRKVSILALTFFASLNGGAQDRTRQVDQPARFLHPNPPVTVVVDLDGKEMLDRVAKAGPDWLKRVSFQVTNISGKNISAIRLDLILKEPIYETREASPESAGIVINLDLRLSEPRIDVLPPGGATTIRPTSQQIDYWTKYAREQGIADIERAILEIRQVEFTDDTGWYLGHRTRKDPQSGKSVFIQENAGPDRVFKPVSSFVEDRVSAFFWILILQPARSLFLGYARYRPGWVCLAHLSTFIHAN